MGGRADDSGERLRPQQHAEAPLRRHRSVGDRLRLHQGAIDCTNCKRDFAPTIGFYPYNVIVQKPTLVVRSLKPTPARPVAGRPFTLKLVAARSDTGARSRTDVSPASGGLALHELTAQLQRVQGGAATCTWNIPANAKGKTFRGSVTVAFEGLRAGQSYTGKVR